MPARSVADQEVTMAIDPTEAVPARIGFPAHDPGPATS
jgi:hypothetical protein